MQESLKERIARVAAETNMDEFRAVLKVMHDAIVRKGIHYGLQFNGLTDAQDTRIEYDSIAVRTQGVCHYQVEKNGKYGMLDPLGKVYVPCEMDEIFRENNGASILMRDGKIGFFFIEEEIYVEPAYDEVNDFAYGEPVQVRKGDEWGYLIDDGSFMTDEEIDWYDGHLLGQLKK